MAVWPLYAFLRSQVLLPVGSVSREVALQRGANFVVDGKIQEVSRHKIVNVLMGYVRSAELFKGHAGSGFM
jgi:hypothetical protein